MNQSHERWGDEYYDSELDGGPDDDFYDDDAGDDGELLDDDITNFRLDLSNITCEFCVDMIRYALKARMLEEEHFLHEIPQFHKEKEDNRGSLTQRAKSCKVCAMALSALNDLPPMAKPWAETVENNPKEDPFDVEVWWEFGRPRSRFARPMLGIVEEGKGTASFKFRETPAIFLQTPSREITPLSTGSELVSYAVLQQWYQKCLGHGGSLQDISLVNDLQSATIRLIDVEDNCLCNVPTSVAYIALSYVWGSSASASDKLMMGNLQQLYSRDGISRHVTLARTVRDAFEVTRGLGMRYLFVDRLCIIQDSSKDKALYVEAMHEIYNKANITIVAAAGEDAQYGLPGTRGSPRVQTRLYHPRQSLQIDSERELVRVYEEEFPPADLLEQNLQKSVWATRGWTYQEHKLSERMLIFTDQAVFWKCSHICLYEDCPHDQHEHLSDGLMNMKASDAFGRDALWWTIRKLSKEGERNHDLSQQVYNKKRDHWISVVFRLRVQDFCERKLTFPRDIDRAFQGMIGAFKIIYDPLPVHHGLLTRSIPSELMWACSGCASKSHTAHEKHHGLRNTVDNEGIPTFPTWSWHAWQDQPTWFHSMQEPEEAMRAMDSEIALTTSMYTGTSDTPGSKLLFRESRHIDSRVAGDLFQPASWMAQHKLREKALMFQGLVSRSRPGSGPQVDALGSLATLTRLGLEFPRNSDAPIFEWLQRPSRDTFQKPVGAMCLTYIDQTSPTHRVSQLVVMMLLSYRHIEGQEVAFREGLFTCEVSRFRSVEQFFGPEVLFLC